MDTPEIELARLILNVSGGRARTFRATSIAAIKGPRPAPPERVNVLIERAKALGIHDKMEKGNWTLLFDAGLRGKSLFDGD